jgi:hypothetical protein
MKPHARLLGEVLLEAIMDIRDVVRDEARARLSK